MTLSVLGSLDFERYERILKGILPGGGHMRLTDDAGEIYGPASQDGPCDREGYHKEKPLYNDLGELIAVFRLHAEGEMTRIEEAFEVLELSICNDYRLVSELNSMAEELAERYEELNLLYETGEQVKSLRESQEVLGNLVRNCAESLGADYVALLLPEKRVFMAHGSCRRAEPGTSPRLSRLYNWCRQSGRSLVLNRPPDPLHRRLWEGEPEKVLCCPVLDNNCVVSGIFLMVNSVARRDFSNSDRNLAEVMAKNISKLIQANYDTLTGLLNRRTFESLLEEKLEKEGQENCLLLFNLDRFQVLNDTTNRQVGDQMMRTVARLLADYSGPADVVGRLGGDEFGVLLCGCDLERGKDIADQLRRRIGEIDCEWEQRRLEVSVSVGVAPMDADTLSLSCVFDAAEVACGVAKERGRNRVQVFSQGDEDLNRRRDEMFWVSRIQTGLREDRFQLYCQPIVPLNEGKMHFEILLRLQENDEILSPGAFMPAAERYGLMSAIDRWVVSRALESLSSCWSGKESEFPTWSINLSGQSLGENDFLDFVRNELRAAGIPKRLIGFEITETEAIQNLEVARRFIEALKAEGCQFALDDFGTGFSSFAYLKNFPVDYLKIDGSFVKDIGEDPVSEAMVGAMNQIGHLLGKKIIAEYVHSPAIKSRLGGMGVDYVQGYCIAEPSPLLGEKAQKFFR